MERRKKVRGRQEGCCATQACAEPSPVGTLGNLGLDNVLKRWLGVQHICNYSVHNYGYAHTGESLVYIMYIHDAAHCVGADHDQRQTRPGSPGKADRPRASTVTSLAGCRCGRGRLLPRADRPCLRGPECAAGRALRWGLHAYAGAQGREPRAVFRWTCLVGAEAASRALGAGHIARVGAVMGARDGAGVGEEWMRYMDDENVGAAACVACVAYVACCPEGVVVSSRFLGTKTSSRQSVVPDTGQRTG
ncbi:hypothetical protein BT67DRAFT_270975 [Trichocladium antarcticum]|uniref:Uncharacterized protein n=1 Tax=Trichocladium antarcticum TaxID=1450529 RepID=A0AAN6UM59_9PEZI|nr:hypothetical protein BT67DRAFT_270975 [Trichocladium antarcticum]